MTDTDTAINEPSARSKLERAVIPSLTPATPLFIVFNTKSGSRDRSASEQTMRSILRDHGRTHTFLPIDDPRELRKTAKRAVEGAIRDQGAVIVAGGDGTINCVAEATLASGRPFGIIPQGTFNYSSRAHGIPLETEPATRALLDARIEPMQIGLVNDRIFLVNASVGLYPELLEEREHYKRQYGRKRYVALWAAVMTILRSEQKLTLEIEHDRERETVVTPTLFVGNNPLQLEQVGLPEAEDVERARRLAGVVVRAHGSAALLQLLASGMLGRLGRADEVHNFPFRRMTVRPGRRSEYRQIKVATDGEIHLMKPPLTFSIAPQPLMLMVPRTQGTP